MQQWQDEALILKVDKFGDSDAIVHLFTPVHGLNRGVVKHAFSGKGRGDLQPGTLVEAKWKARLPEHMGTVTLESRHGFATRVMHDPLRLAAIGSILALLSATLAERDAHPELYASTILFLKHVAAGVAPLIWLAEYVRLELSLLHETGFGLDLASCAATGSTENLTYVSPKSARAVSAGAGAPYQAKLLPLPEFLKGGDHPDMMADVMAGAALTSYFLEARLLPALHRHNPTLRQHFLGLLQRHTDAA